MSPELTRFKTVMRQNGNFVTKQRLELFKHLQASPALTINKLIDNLPNMDQATIYRNIKLFENAGIISRLQLGSNSKLELSNMFHDHHHHMSCIKCGKVVAWEEDPTIELRIQTVAMKLGFIPQDHQLEIRGLCQSCQKKHRPQLNKPGSSEASHFQRQV